MTSRLTWSLLPACYSVESARSGSLGGSMATARRRDVTRLVIINSIRCHHAGRLLSSPLPIAEMSSTVRCVVMANRLSPACS